MNIVVRVVVLALACVAGAVSAQVGCVAAAESDTPSHAWVVLPDESDLLLAHAPPRDPVAAQAGADPGRLRPMRQLREPPALVAAMGDRVYLVFPIDATPAGAARRVLTARSLPAGVAGLWTDEPTGLFDPAPAIPGPGDLLGVGVSAGRAGSLHALLRDGDDLRLLRMAETDWTPVPLPDAVPPAPADAALVSFGPGVLLAVRDADGGSRAWTLEADAWSPVDLGGWDRFWAASWRRGFAREVIVGLPDPDGGTEVWSLSPGHAWRVGVAGVTPDAASAVLASSRRLLLADRDAEETIRLVEMSLVTGRVLHDGPPAARGPVSADEFRLIVAMLLAVMVAALLVIVRPAGEQAWSVPSGNALADPGRRMMAAVFDGLLVVWVTAPAFGVGLREVLTLQVLLMDDHAWLVIPVSLMGGALAMGVWEGLLGFTPGKFLLGMRVYRATPGELARLGVFWGLVRNAIKWLVPPVAALALLDRAGRHRGDTAARAVVVVRAHEASEEDG